MADGPPAPTHQRRSRPPGAYRNLPLWGRFVVSGLVAIVLLAAMVIFVSGHNTDSPTLTNPVAATRANRQSEILVEQDQAPHVASLPHGLSARAGLERVLHARLLTQVAGGSLSGPLSPARCRETGAPHGSTSGFSCSIAAGGITYPYLAAVDTAKRRITLCKRDPPPAPSDVVPVSPRCRA